jgi:predicted dienelactone hydrolase
MKALLTLLWFLTALSLPATAAPFQPKMDSLDMGSLDTGRPSKITIWYPQGACPGDTVRLCLADAAVTSKVLLFSHGSMGSAGDYAWLGDGLAAAGFIVVGVNHYGESRIYGESTQDPRSTAYTWHRAQDVSALLTRLAGEKLFQRDVDWSNVVVLGHSEGGQTAAMLAGARFDLRRIAPYCESADAKGDLGCNYSRDSAHAPEQFVALFNAGYQDLRIKKIVLLDPAIGSALQPESLGSIALPSLIVGAIHNDFLPWRNHGARYAAGIPNAQTILLDGQEGHFVFLSQCRLKVQVMGVPLCEDRPGVDRAAVQRDLLPSIVAFVRVDNEPASVTRQPDSISNASAPYTHSISLFQILRYTPAWVFALLAALCVFGLLQTRTRRVAMWLALLLPAAMLILSLSGILQYVGLWLPALAAWVLGIGAASMLCLKTMNRAAAIYDVESHKLIVVGSWIPMLAILGIFAVRYALGVARALEFDIAQDRNVQLAVSFLLGAFSGIFLARALLFWRTHAARFVERPSAS